MRDSIIVGLIGLVVGCAVGIGIRILVDNSSSGSAAAAAAAVALTVNSKHKIGIPNNLGNI